MSAAALLQQAVAFHQHGDLAQAENTYRAVLRDDPRNPDALALLGTLLSQQQKHTDAIHFITQALVLDSTAPLFHFHLGNAQEKAGLPAEAEASFSVATALAPQFAEAWYNLGNAQRTRKKNGAAEKSYAKVLALDPHHALAANNLALLHMKKQEYKTARDLVQNALTQHARHTTLLFTLIDIAFEINDLPLALGTAAMVAEIKLGIKNGELFTAIAVSPDFDLGDEQVKNCLLTLGVGHMLQGRLPVASAILRFLLAVEPDMEEAFLTLGSIALARNKLDDAEEAFAQSFMLDPSNTAAPWNRSMPQLTKGDLREGLARYRWRWHALEKLKTVALDAPLWDGSPLTGKTLLVHEEQGFGDSLQMLRFVPQLRASGAKVYVYARPALYALLENWTEADKVLPWNLETRAVPPEVDYVCGVMDLPGHLGIHVGNIPAKVPYLPNPLKDDARFQIKNSRPKIGLVWQGNPLHKRDHERSIPFALLEPLLAIKEVDFYSLQYKPTEKDRTGMNAAGITDLTAPIKNLADTAATLAQLDLLITIDSAPAHLAGALGLPVWVLVTANPDWRWLLDRSDSPWYPGLRLFRQPEPGNWAAVINEVTEALGQRHKKIT
jgi:Tfp pilus assembly protein PilF